MDSKLKSKMKRMVSVLMLVIAFFCVSNLAYGQQSSDNTDKGVVIDCNQIKIEQSDRKGTLWIATQSENGVWTTTNPGNCSEGWGLPTPEEAICMCKKAKSLLKGRWYWTNAQINDRQAYAIRMKDCKLFVKGKKNTGIVARCIKK